MQSNSVKDKIFNCKIKSSNGKHLMVEKWTSFSSHDHHIFVYAGEHPRNTLRSSNQCITHRRNIT